MRFINKFDAGDEIMVILAIEKEPLKEKFMVEEVIVNDLTDEDVLKIIKEDLLVEDKVI